MKKSKPRILIVNDDGIGGNGLAPLRDALRGVGTVRVVVPDRERSTTSHSLTIHKPVRLDRVSPGVHTLSGKPADCARFGVLHAMRGRCDLVVSGINEGYNLGSDVIYSGTMGAAREASLLGVPAFAISQGPGGDFLAASAFAVRLSRLILARGLPAGVVLNVNVPPRAASRLRGTKITKLGKRVYDNRLTRRRDPRGGDYFWLTGRFVRGVRTPGSDVGAVETGFVSVTPVAIDTTHPTFAESLLSWDL